MSETKRKILIIIVLLLVVLFGVGQFFAGSTINAPTPAQPADNQLATQVIDYVPAPPGASTPVEKGSCFASSVAAPYRSDAWRCTVGNAISDPCFAIPGSTSTLACGENPASTDVSSVFVLQLTKPLPSPDVPSSTPGNWAWLVELANGTVCSPYTGTRPFTAAGEVAIYACNSANSAPSGGGDMIFGDLNNATTTWTAEVGTLSTATSTFPPIIVASATVPVFAVWQ